MEKQDLPKTLAEQYLKIMNGTTNEPTMRWVTKMTNVDNPYQYTYPCNDLEVHKSQRQTTLHTGIYTDTATKILNQQ